MTERQWLSCSEPNAMLDALRGIHPASERKLRLWAVACVRRVWHSLTGETVRRAVEAAEGYADGLVGREEWSAAYWVLTSHISEPRSVSDPTFFAHAATAYLFADARADPVGYAADISPWAAGAGVGASRSYAEEHAAHCQLLRDLFGNPFQAPPAIKPSLLTHNDGLILKLAQAAYDERLLPSGHLDPARLAVLADALEDEGCADGCPDAQLLRHLRAEGPHVRGCWAVDAVLGKS